MNEFTKIIFDTDGTLVYLPGTPGKIADSPRYDVINFLLYLHKLGCQIYAHSGGGVEYCQNKIDRIGLTDIVTVVPKGSMIADISFDDEEVKLGKVNIQVNKIF